MSYVDPSGAGSPAAGQPIEVQWGQDVQSDIEAFHWGSPAGGDLSGTYPNPKVAGLQGVTVDTTAPTSGEVLAFNGTMWSPSSSAGGITVHPASALNGSSPIGPYTIQAGTVTGNASSGLLTVSYPQAFTHGVLSLVATNWVGTMQDSQVLVISSNTTSFTLGFVVNGSAWTGGVNATYMAIGW